MKLTCSICSFIFGFSGLIALFYIWCVYYDNVFGQKFNGQIIDFKFVSNICCSDNNFCNLCYDVFLIGRNLQGTNCTMQVAFHTSLTNAKRSIDKYNIGNSIQWISVNDYKNCCEYNYTLYLVFIIVFPISVFLIILFIICCAIDGSRRTNNVITVENDFDTEASENEEDEIVPYCMVKIENNMYYDTFSA